jgi:hypothetical protein
MRTRRASKHAILRNEPDWKSTVFMWNRQSINELGCEGGKFQSGSFGMELGLAMRTRVSSRRWQPGRLPYNTEKSTPTLRLRSVQAPRRGYSAK